MNIALAVMGVVLTLWMLYAFRKLLRKSVVPALVWLANKLGALPVKAVLWCWSRRWSLVLRAARLLLFIVAVGVPVVALFPMYFGIGRLAGIHLAVRVAFSLAWFIPCWRKVQPSPEGSPRIEGIAILGLPWRSVGCGLRFLFRPLGIPIEEVFKDAEIKRVPGEFKMDVETKNRDSQPVKIVFGWTIHPLWFISYLKTDEAKRFEALKNWISSIVTIVVHDLCDNREQVYKNAKEIGRLVTNEFKHKTIGGLFLPEYFGVDLDAIGVADIDQPEEIKKAEQAKEVAQEMAKAKTIASRNKRNRAIAQVKAAAKMHKEFGTPLLSPEKAQENVYLEDSHTTKEIKQINFGEGAADVAGSIAAGLAGLFKKS